jgi:hypothetical protein
MEQTIMNAFIESIQTILKDSVAKMTEEARKFTLVVTTLSRLPPSAAVTASSAVTASTASSAVHASATTTAASATLDQRVRVLETTILDRTQKMLHGVMEDISELHSRVDKIQNPTPSWDNDNEEFPIPWFDRQPFTFQTPRNEIVHETPVENIRTLHVNPSVLHLPEPVEEPEEVEEVKVEEKKVEEVKASEPEQVVEEVVEEEVVEEEAVEEEAVEEEKKAVEAETDEEGEEEELEDFQHQGKLYYRDKDNNVYVEDEEGDIDSTPVGRWIQAKNTIKFFPK